MEKSVSMSAVSVQIDDTEVRPGQWFMAKYGYENVIGRCTDVLPGGLVLKFRWGSLFRTRKFVEYGKIRGRVSDPRLFRF